jgi:Tfp pilus assembly protein PilN
MKLYIEITTSKLIIAKLKESFDKYHLVDKEEFKLEKIEFFDNKLFNISAIYLYLKKYLTKNKIKKINTIISLPLVATNKSCYELTILQISLLVNKLDLRIEKIIGENILRKDEKMPYKFFFAKKELKNQLDFFKKLQTQEKTSINSWVFLTIFLTISYTLFFYKNQNIKKEELKKLTLKNQNLENSLKELNVQIKKAKELRVKNENLQKKINQIEKYQSSNNNPLKLLINISQKIPTNCKLTKINTNIKKDKKGLYAILEGKALIQEEINEFLSNLKENPELSKAKIINIQKNESLSKADEYLFKIECKLTKA